MRGPRLEVAEILRRYKDPYVSVRSPSVTQKQVIDDLIACRTAALGGHVRQCQKCGHKEIAYNSCRNRHCPKCQGQKQADWLAAHAANLLEVPYFHIVFTLPNRLSPLVLQNKRLLYDLLFYCASQTLLVIARDPAHLGARIGFTAILHSWGQTLLHHPHLHCLVPAGGLSADQQRWVPTRQEFFLPVRVLARVFRGTYLAGLRNAWKQGQLQLAGRLAELSNPQQWDAYLEGLQQTDWVVYAKPPFGSPQQVLKYLARYTHRVAISNRRLLSLRADQVAFRYKDYRRGRRDRVMRLSAIEFIRRFLLHTLPKRFVRIRHYGFLANCVRQEKLALCRRLVASSSGRQADRVSPDTPEPTEASEKSTGKEDSYPCPICKLGVMLVIEKVPAEIIKPIPRMNSPGNGYY